MAEHTYHETLEQFKNIARAKVKDRTMVSLIIDSPWLPGYAGVNMIDFYFEPRLWLDIYLRVHDDLPGVVFVPDAWVEFGMATEPSGWGVGLRWSESSPPMVRPYPGGLTALLEAEPPDPEMDGLMPAVLRQYERTKPELHARGMAPRMVAARGPLAVASHLTGATELLMATQLEPDKCLQLLERTTELCIRWLQCQLERIDDPLGILVLDDVVGMMSPDDAGRFAIPLLRRIFDSFPGLVHIFHNDTPNPNVYQALSTIGMDVFNFSHDVDMEQARELVGPDVVLMGNLPPLEILVRGTVEQVRDATEETLEKSVKFGPVLISPGGGVSPGTPIENLQAMLEVVKAH